MPDQHKTGTTETYSAPAEVGPALIAQVLR
jgi:hypothetical protein